MKLKTTKRSVILVLMTLVLVLMILTQGCKKKKQPTSQSARQAKPTANKPATAKPAAAKPATAKPVTQAVEQTICPVMGKAIDKSIFTEHKGKRVYFCCKECQATFEANPEKYVSKLPQFKN
ncbi:MAG: YHS domain-containing protein [Phycisphaerae bacterium]|nr:YHS domain-containing protein [Phycisphaerae bacterium]